MLARLKQGLKAIDSRIEHELSLNNPETAMPARGSHINIKFSDDVKELLVSVRDYDRKVLVPMAITGTQGAYTPTLLNGYRLSKRVIKPIAKRIYRGIAKVKKVITS